MQTGPLITSHFRALGEIDDNELLLLTALQDELLNIEAGSIFQNIGQADAPLFTLHAGWACAVRCLADGQRQVLDIFLPGQILGLQDIGHDTTQSELVALTDIEVCRVSRQQLRELLGHHPRLAELFFVFLAREHAMLVERLVNIARRPAGQRLAHFLLELQARVNKDEPEFDLPLTQADIGDALGLSAVHVSRTLGRLKRGKLITVNRGRVRIEDASALRASCEFDKGYLSCVPPLADAPP